ncbi:monogalactosyldiacylglycerol synthase 2, chloroplastic-like [Senna tora]|uniref:monogalactosyldiacylglycerol synthase n=1 Tax=Senna tora TaxID=362788 RepID=A0A834W274_9FABA|nr:monogalactosyldiacylglycerol synthase 2, chloroplastic-like [Senna tora]
METSVTSTPRSLAGKVFQKVGGYYYGSQSQKRSGHEAHVNFDDDDDCGGDDSGMELAQIGADRTKNVLILMSDTGGGHRASAEAIRDAFQMEFGDEYSIFVKDVWKENTGWPLNDMESSYKFMVKHVQLWNVAFHSTSPRWVHSVYLAAFAAYYAKYNPLLILILFVFLLFTFVAKQQDFLELGKPSSFLWGEVEAGLMEYKPDIIISVHPLMQHIPLWVLKWQGLLNKVVFVTVITDLSSCHPTWFHPGVNRCYCPSQEVAKRALQDGLEESRIRVYGLPIRPSFARAVISKDQLREELELDPNLPAVLLMGGGEGMGPVKKTAKALGESLWDKEAEKPIGQLIIICGRNKNLVSTLQSLEWKIPVKIRGFETQMQKWMGACDCIITKAGPGTIAEALIRGLPIILNDYIPGQERGNVPYVVDNGAGVFTRSPKETARIVAEWFSTKSDELQRMSENALKLAQPEAVFDIVKDIHELAEQNENLGFQLENWILFSNRIILRGHRFIQRKEMVHHSSFVDEEGVDKACGCPLLPLKSHIKGPAPTSDQDRTDIVDEAITFFRANVFFRNFDIKSPADKLLIYLTFYINVALKRLEGCRTLAEGTKAIINLGLENVPVPGETGFPFPGLFPLPQSKKEAVLTFTWLPYYSWSRDRSRDTDSGLYPQTDIPTSEG